MSKVYVVQQSMIRQKDGSVQPKFDLEPAKEYGDVHVLINSYANPMRSDLIIDHLKQELKGYTDDDWIIPVGNPSIIGWAISLASQYNDGYVRTLMWNDPQQKYYEIDAQIF